jgi:hypothetical protein
MRPSLSLLACALAIAGCNDATPASTDESQVYTVTVVELHGDGAPTVTVYTTTLAAQRLAAAGVGERAEEIAKQSPCVTADMHMFDKTGFAGNEICFHNAGTATLANYVRTQSPLTHWNDATKSFISGESAGNFADVIGDHWPFTTYHSMSGSEIIVAQSVTLTLSPPPPPSDMTMPHDMGSGGGGGGSDLGGPMDMGH